MTTVTALRAALALLWRTDRFLTAVGLLLLATLVPMTLGLLLDPRIIGGAPAWMKPAKFALSTGIYSLTLVWILSWLPEWRRVRRTASVVTGLVFLIEVGIIAAQAGRGTTSHFNMSTPLDALLFQVMGAGIVLQTLAAALVAIAVWRHRFPDRVMGLALRLGLTLTIAGATAGGLMTQRSDSQRAAARAGAPLPVQGAHTVGAPDGGPGLPVTGWSLEHGDLRIAHFLGLHAMQALPLLVLFLRHRRVSDGVAARMVRITTASYASLFAILLWQALRGQSIVQPDVLTLAVLAGWAATSALAAWRARRPASLDGNAERPRWVSA
jgi:hypothetical protein